MLKIVNVPDPILGNPVKPVQKIDGKIIKLVHDMEKTLVAQDDPPGVGLAAPQVGHNLALFIIKPMPESKIEAFINPKILKIEEIKEKQTDKTSAKGNKKLKKGTPLEGCLSIPRIWSPVKRPEKVLLKYQTITGEEKTRWFSGFEAVIIQHEVDHLNGILFTQRSLEQNIPLFEEKEGELHRLKY